MAIFKLINKYFISSIIGPISLFGMPFIFAVLYYTIGKEQFLGSFPIIVSIGIVSVSLMVIPTLLIDLRKSLMLKRIGAAKVKPEEFILVLSLYFTIVILISIGYSFILYAIFGTAAANGDLVKAFSKHDFGSSIYACIILGLISIVISLLLGMLIKNAMVASTIAFIFIFLSLFTSGLMMPIGTLRQVLGLRMLGYIIPLDWPLLMLQGAWGVNGLPSPNNLVGHPPNEIIDVKLFKLYVDNIWNLSKPFDIWTTQYGGVLPIKFSIMDRTCKSFNLIAPYVFSIISILLIRITFKWSER